MTGLGSRAVTGTCVMAAGLILAGCQATGQRYAFPATWPGSEPLSAEAPTVQVLPIQIPVLPAEDQAPSGAGLPTAAVLSALFIKYLHVNGLNATLEPPKGSGVRYLLQCRVPRLSYDVGESYPQARIYQAELACALSDAQTQQTIWQRQLSQRYDKTVLVDLMTKLPTVAHEDARIMYRECIVPLWDAMAQSVGTVVVSQRQETSALPPQGFPEATLPAAPESP